MERRLELNALTRPSANMSTGYGPNLKFRWDAMSFPGHRNRERSIPMVKKNASLIVPKAVVVVRKVFPNRPCFVRIRAEKTVTISNSYGL